MHVKKCSKRSNSKEPVINAFFGTTLGASRTAIPGLANYQIIRDPPPGHSDLLLLATVSTRLTLIRLRTRQLRRVLEQRINVL
ncbi:hypothetical protein YC2023_055864 [Brassica napus]